MDFQRRNIKSSIQSMLSDEKVDLRKTITLTLPDKQLMDLDSLSEIAKEICGKNISRQLLIESAVSAYIQDFKEELKNNYGIESINNIAATFDTLIVAAQITGFQSTFINKNEWFWLRLGKDKIPKIKYLAIYVNSPVSAITHYAEIDYLTSYPSGYKAKLSNIKQLPQPIPLGNLNASYVRPNRYVMLSKLLSAKTYADLL